MKKVLAIFIMLIILTPNVASKSYASGDLGLALWGYALSPIVVPIMMGFMDGDYRFYVGAKPAYLNSLDYFYADLGDDELEWDLDHMYSVSAVFGVAKQDKGGGTRMEVELVYNKLEDQMGSVKDGYEAVYISNYKQLIAMYNAYYDGYLGDFVLSTRLGLGVVHHNFDLGNGNTYESIRETLFAAQFGLELQYFITENHALDLSGNILVGGDGNNNVSGGNASVGYKYWF
jgi:hypothetical protein